MKRLHVLVSLAVLILVSNWALLRPQLFPIHDFVHGARIAQMHQALADGHFPPRWSKDFGYGYGMPLYEFYGPLPFFVGGALYSLFSLETSVKLLFFIAAAGTTLGAYRVGELLSGRKAGLAAATLATLAPYRAVNAYVRGAVSELWGILWSVWVVASVIGILQRKKLSWLWFAVSVAALVLSHNLTALMMALVSFGLCMVVWLVSARLYRFDRQYFWNVTKDLIGGAALGAGLSSFYTIPAFLEKEFVQIEKFMLSGYFDFSLHFLYIRQLLNPAWKYGGSTYGPDDGITFFLGYSLYLVLAVAVVLISIGVYLWLNGKTRIGRFAVSRWLRVETTADRLHLSLLAGTVIITGMTVLMALTKTEAIWRVVELFRYLQFPWRWLSMTVVTTMVVTGLLFALLKSRAQSILLTVIVLASALHLPYFQPTEYLEDASQLYYADPERISSHMSEILPDYIPVDLNLELPVAESRNTFLKGTEHTVLADKTHEYLMSLTAPAEMMVTVAIAYYPGWQAEVDGQSVPLSISKDGLLQVVVPQGQHQVGFRFTETPLRTVANGISIVSMLILVGGVVRHEVRS